MNTRIIHGGVYAAATMFAVLAGFFFVFNAVFSDVSTLSDRLLSVIVVSGVYLVLGFAFGRATFRPPMWWTIFLSGPALGMLALYTFSEPDRALLHLFFGFLTFGSSMAGATVSSKG